ncbi:16S rRNA (cytidine(1402)-2'-O)-methyltransferase [Bordetella bronchialis]|uniref:16S rRNA (cytidine(1402)-2'-O)-methyltransferase n=1 Tax=Bordetella bronchialis TaxID=463025 RepID=UPI0009F44E28|nr:16S rRNA (cytidine(1402)-2'-O)-methyltransferase [Bordetella bronchialis]
MNENVAPSAGSGRGSGSAAGSDPGSGSDPGPSPALVDGNHAWRRVAERVAAQQWPPATLYVVATPIGNLGDLSLRAWQALSRADVIAAEDTRESRTLLDAWGIATPLMAAHRHNEAAAAQAIRERLAQGQRVALVSDAGAPAVSDPGARIVRAVRQAGHAVVPVPGPSAVIAALMASGVTTDENPAYVFAGFPPPKSAARQRWLAQWCGVPAPVVMFESPHRLAATLADMRHVLGGQREVTIARELTKRFEEVATMPLEQAADWLGAQPHRGQGEFVLIAHAAPAKDAEDTGVDAATDTLLDALLESVSVRDAARIAARISGLPRDVLYARALARKPS